jgi:mRNA interferase YafQ
MYKVVLSAGYRKALKRIVRNKDFNHLKLESVIHLLETGQKLDRKYRDHELSGEFEGFRECHVQSDTLLVYQIYKNELVLLLIDIGSHSELF